MVANTKILPLIVIMLTGTVIGGLLFVTILNVQTVPVGNVEIEATEFDSSWAMDIDQMYANYPVQINGLVQTQSYQVPIIQDSFNIYSSDWQLERSNVTDTSVAFGNGSLEMNANGPNDAWAYQELDYDLSIDGHLNLETYVNISGDKMLIFIIQVNGTGINDETNKSLNYVIGRKNTCWHWWWWNTGFHDSPTEHYTNVMDQMWDPSSKGFRYGEWTRIFLRDIQLDYLNYFGERMVNVTGIKIFHNVWGSTTTNRTSHIDQLTVYEDSIRYGWEDDHGNIMDSYYFSGACITSIEDSVNESTVRANVSIQMDVYDSGILVAENIPVGDWIMNITVFDTAIEWTSPFSYKLPENNLLYGDDLWFYFDVQVIVYANLENPEGGTLVEASASKDNFASFHVTWVQLIDIILLSQALGIAGIGGLGVIFGMGVIYSVKKKRNGSKNQLEF